MDNNQRPFVVELRDWLACAALLLVCALILAVVALGVGLRPDEVDAPAPIVRTPHTYLEAR